MLAYGLDNDASTLGGLPKRNGEHYCLRDATPEETDTFSNMNNGMYASWNIKGNVTINIATSAYSNEQIYFYGADGKKLAVYSLAASGGNPTLSVNQTKIWFAGRLLTAQDRRQSQGKYFLYGEYRYSPSLANPSNDTEKFATYTRDASTGLDYAYQRYDESAVSRFHTADNFGTSAVKNAPQTWNRYSYSQNNPQQFYDPPGQYATNSGGGACAGYPDDPDFFDGLSDCDGCPTGASYYSNYNSCPPTGSVGGAQAKAHPAKTGTRTCSGTATFRAVGGKEAPDLGALFSFYPKASGGSIRGGVNGKVAAQRNFLGLTTRQLRTWGTQIQVLPSIQATIKQFSGPTGPLSVSDYGDPYIQATKGVAFDIYRFPTTADGDGFGKHTATTTVTFPLASGGTCPPGWTVVP